MTENEQQRLQKIQEKIAEMKAKEQAIISRDKQRQRKERTRRLIQNGALAEKYLNCPDIQPQEFEKILQMLANIQEVRNAIKI